MTTIAFDTLKFSDTLKAAGVPDKQADAFASSASDLATKGDVRDLRNEMELLRRDMLSMEQRLTIKLGAFITVAVGILIAVLRVSH